MYVSLCNVHKTVIEKTNKQQQQNNDYSFLFFYFLFLLVLCLREKLSLNKHVCALHLQSLGLLMRPDRFPTTWDIYYIRIVYIYNSQRNYVPLFILLL